MGSTHGREVPRETRSVRTNGLGNGFGAGTGAKRPPGLHSSHTLQPAGCVNIGKVPFLPRSELACWWSICHLIRSCPNDTWFWTFTSPFALPLWWFSRRHSKLVGHVKNFAARRKVSSHGGTIPRNWGGVRVFETNPKGTGYHSHWVLRGRADWWLMQEAALKAGLGKVVWVDPKPATMKTAWYLATYLTKEKNMVGARKWANIGTWDGITGRDIINDSERIRDIKAWQVYFRGMGKHRYLAYRMALQMVDEGIPLPGTEPF